MLRLSARPLTERVGSGCSNLILASHETTARRDGDGANLIFVNARSCILKCPHRARRLMRSAIQLKGPTGGRSLRREGAKFGPEIRSPAFSLWCARAGPVVAVCRVLLCCVVSDPIPFHSAPSRFHPIRADPIRSDPLGSNRKRDTTMNRSESVRANGVSHNSGSSGGFEW